MQGVKERDNLIRYENQYDSQIHVDLLTALNRMTTVSPSSGA